MNQKHTANLIPELEIPLTNGSFLGIINIHNNQWSLILKLMAVKSWLFLVNQKHTYMKSP